MSASLRHQVNVLADRLSVLTAIIMDCKELASSGDTIPDEVWHALVVAALTDSKDLDRWRGLPAYKEAKSMLRDLVKESVRELREAA